MKRPSILAALLMIVLAAEVSCGGDIDRGEVSTEHSTTAPLSQKAAPYERLGPVEDVSYKLARRVTARIQVPLGHSREEISEALRLAAEDIAREEGARAVMVFAYRPGDDADGIYTVGRVVYAPNGRWEDAAEPGAMQAVVELGTLYFSAPDVPDSPSSLAVGDWVVLQATGGESIIVSDSRDKWGDESIVAKLPPGTDATIIEEFRKALTADYELRRYRIRFAHHGRPLEGWVFGSNLQRSAKHK